MSENPSRRDVAHWAQRYLSGALAFDEFLELMPEDSNDEEIAELLDLIVHEPQKGGIFGAGPEEYAKHRGRIRALVDILTNESDSAF